MDTGGVGKWKITVSDGLLELSFRIWINFLFKMFIIKEINTIYPPRYFVGFVMFFRLHVKRWNL